MKRAMTGTLEAASRTEGRWNWKARDVRCALAGPSDLHLGMSDDPRRPGKMLPDFLHHEVLPASVSGHLGILTPGPYHLTYA